MITKEEHREILLRFIETNKCSKEIDKLRLILKYDANTSVKHRSKPGMPNLDSIASTTETAFQRAIFSRGFSNLNTKKGDLEIEWLDLELPITLSPHSRRICIDLVGKSNDRLILCELKYKSKSNSNSPLYAMLELLVYFYLIRCNYKNLDEEKVFHNFGKEFEWKDYSPFTNSNLELIVVANKEYWSYWLGRRDSKTLKEKISSLREKISFEIDFYETVDEDFDSQKGDKEKYEPKISDNNWGKINLTG